MAQLKDLLVTGNARILGKMYTNNAGVAFGTCDTAAATAAKVVVIADPTWSLQVGSIIGVKFTTTNTAGTVTLNVNGSGAIQVSAGATRPYTGTSNRYTGYANRTICYMYDGTYWHWMGDGTDANDNTYTSVYCSTAAGTAAKGGSCTNFKLLANTYLYITIVNTNTSAGAITLNVNSTGAKPIYINGSASSASNYTLTAGTYLVYYNGTNYYFRTDGKITGAGVGTGTTAGVLPMVFTGTGAPAASLGNNGDIYIVTG